MRDLAISLKQSRAAAGGTVVDDESDALQWLIWQLTDSAFPTGGFAHSAGLEAAWQHGEVRDAGELGSFASAMLRQLRLATLPFVAAAHRDPTRLPELDEHFDVFTPNHVANRASRQQGRAFLLATQRIYPSIAHAGDLLADIHTSGFKGHLPPVFGAILQRLEVSLPTALQMFGFGQLRCVVSAAVRLNIVGPMEGQAIQHELAGLAADCARDSLAIDVREAAQTSPLLELWQGSQDRLYSRLFQS